MWRSLDRHIPYIRSESKRETAFRGSLSFSVQFRCNYGNAIIQNIPLDILNPRAFCTKRGLPVHEWRVGKHVGHEHGFTICGGDLSAASPGASQLVTGNGQGGPGRYRERHPESTRRLCIRSWPRAGQPGRRSRFSVQTLHPVTLRRGCRIPDPIDCHNQSRGGDSYVHR
jgi:hypothetical protein